MIFCTTLYICERKEVHCHFCGTFVVVVVYISLSFIYKILIEYDNDRLFGFCGIFICSSFIFFVMPQVQIRWIYEGKGTQVYGKIYE